MAYTYRLVKGSPLTHAEYDENFYTVDSQYTAALEAAELAEKWASEAEDIEVVTGGYSALHWAAKAAASVGSITDEVAQAQAARDAADGFATDAQTYAGQSMTYRDQAEGYKNDAQTYAGNALTSADLAEDWAIQPEDVEVTPGNYSALHWAAKADAEAVAALSAKTDAEAARDLAQQWAEELEDVEVITGAYSAFHWAKKSEGFRDFAQTYAGQALSYRDAAETFAGNASTSAADAEEWATKAEDLEVEPGLYSSLHYAAKSDEKATVATAAANAAEVHKLKAQDWAEELEDVEVETGMYSAKHHSAKAAASAVAASGFADAASSSADDAAASASTAASEVTDALNPIQSYSETFTTSIWNSTSQSIDLSTGNVHYRELSGVNITSLSFTNVPSTGAVSLTLIVKQDSSVRSITWPGSVLWSGGTEPALDTAGQYYVLTFLTINGGTTWLGFESGGEFA